MRYPGKVPQNVEGDEARDYCGGMMPYTPMHSMAVPLLDSQRLWPAMKRAMALIDNFHRGA